MARVLVVDDSRFSRGVTSRLLVDAGYEVLEAANGALGLESVRKNEPDCVVLDLLMPEMDGIEFLSRLRNEGSDLPVIVATADIQRGTRTQVEALGVNGFINKPTIPEELLSRVTNAIQPSRD